MTTTSETYVVRVNGAAARSLAPALLFAVFALVWSRIGNTGSFLMIGVPIVLLLSLVSARKVWTRLKVDRSGVRLILPGARTLPPQERFAPWSSVRFIVLDEQQSAVRVTLRADAPVLAWQTARVVDPDDPASGATFEGEVPGLDAQACASTIRTVAPGTDVRFGG